MVVEDLWTQEDMVIMMVSEKLVPFFLLARLVSSLFLLSSVLLFSQFFALAFFLNMHVRFSFFFLSFFMPLPSCSFCP